MILYKPMKILFSHYRLSNACRILALILCFTLHSLAQKPIDANPLEIKDVHLKTKKTFFERRSEGIRQYLLEQKGFSSLVNMEKSKYRIDQLQLNDGLLHYMMDKYKIVFYNHLTPFHLLFIVKENNGLSVINNKPGNEYKFDIMIHESSIDVRKELLNRFSSVMATSTMASTTLQNIDILPKNNGDTIGDFCAYAKGQCILFNRANVSMIISGSFKELEQMFSMAKILDNYIKHHLIEDDESFFIPKLLLESSYIENSTAPFPIRDLHSAEREFEQQLKSMPKEEAQRHCLEKALELSEASDENAEELRLYLRGLPMIEESGTTRVLHRICDNAKDTQLLALAVQMQGKWVSLVSEPRRVVINDLAQMLRTEDGELRKRAITSLGRSGSLDALPILLQELEATPMDGDVIAAIGNILGWPKSDFTLDENRLQELNRTATIFRQALESLRKDIIQQDQ